MIFFLILNIKIILFFIFMNYDKMQWDRNSAKLAFIFISIFTSTLIFIHIYIRIYVYNFWYVSKRVPRINFFGNLIFFEKFETVLQKFRWKVLKLKLILIEIKISDLNFVSQKRKVCIS